MTDREEVLALLQENARYSIEDLARLSDLSADRVEACIEDLEADGIIRGYRAVVDWDQLDPAPVRAQVELNVTLDRETSYDDVAERVGKFPEVQSLRLVSGDYDFALEVRADSMGEVSRFISEKVAPIPEISQTVTHYVMGSYKEQGIDFDDGQADDRLSISP